MRKIIHKIGKNWGQMEVLKKKDNSKELFISLKKPNFINKNLYTVYDSFTEDFTEDFLKNLSYFYILHYKINGSNETIEVSIENLKNYLNIDSLILTLKDNDKIIGSIISILLPIEINTELNKNVNMPTTKRFKSIKSEESMVFSCASFLILENKYRSKGYGMALIQESLKHLYDNGGLGAFFINKVSRCTNSVLLKIWDFPLNLKKLDDHKFPYPKDYKHLFEIEKDENYEIVKVEEKNLEESFIFYTNYLKNKKMFFSPNLNYWKKWVASFPTYIIKSNEGNMGLFSFRIDEIRYPINKMKAVYGWLIICIGKQPETLKASLFIGKKFWDILKIYELGDLSDKIISSVNAQKSPVMQYLNFYNVRIFLKPNEIYFPIF